MCDKIRKIFIKYFNGEITAKTAIKEADKIIQKKGRGTKE